MSLFFKQIIILILQGRIKLIKSKVTVKTIFNITKDFYFK